jgi:topoisomerase IA-like protein
MHITPERRAELAARAAERNAKEAAALTALSEAAASLANIRRLNLKPMHQTALWAEWEFAKALKAWDGDGLFDDMFAEACDNLGVDEEGEEVPADPADYGDYLYEQMRDRKLDEQIDREMGQ